MVRRMTALLAYIRCAHLTIYHIIIGNIKEKNKNEKAKRYTFHFDINYYSVLIKL